MMNYLAEAGATMIPGDWLIAVAVAVIGAMGSAAVAYKRGAASNIETTLKTPVPTIHTHEEMAWATDPDLKEHVMWTRNEFQRVWGQFGTERAIHNDELTNIHDRINQQSQATATIKGTVEEIGHNVQQLLHLALHGKTPPRPRS